MRKESVSKKPNIGNGKKSRTEENIQIRRRVERKEGLEKSPTMGGKRSG